VKYFRKQKETAKHSTMLVTSEDLTKTSIYYQENKPTSISIHESHPIY